jgi:hypothetical protein
MEAHSRNQRNAITALIATLHGIMALQRTDQQCRFYFIIGHEETRQPGISDEGLFFNTYNWIKSKMELFRGKTAWIGVGRQGKGTIMEENLERLQALFTQHTTETLALHDWWHEMPTSWIRTDGSGVVKFPKIITIHKEVTKHMVQGEITRGPRWNQVGIQPSPHEEKIKARSIQRSRNQKERYRRQKRSQNETTDRYHENSDYGREQDYYGTATGVLPYGMQPMRYPQYAPMMAGVVVPNQEDDGYEDLWSRRTSNMIYGTPYGWTANTPGMMMQTTADGRLVMKKEM